MNSENDKFQVLSTKVSPRAFKILKRLADKKGLKIYELLQICVDCLVRYTSDQYNLTPELEKVMGIFEHMIGWAGALNIADPTVQTTISEATYYLTADGKKGTRAVHVNRPFFGQWQQDENIQHILDRTLENLVPERYRRLRLLAVENNCSSILELIDLLIERNGSDTENDRQIREGFEDCNRGENNHAVEYGQRTRRKKHYSPDTMPSEQTINFSPDDVPDLPELREDKPFNPDEDAIGI